MKNSWYRVKNGVLIELEDIGAIRRKERARKAGLASAKARTGERMKQTKPKAEKKEQYMYKCKHGVVHNDITFRIYTLTAVINPLILQKGVS